jgi:hypothetical protein
MQRLDEVINYYLTNDTNYALLITGDWGKGKTYYYKNVVEHKIVKTPTFFNARKTYKPVYISLFGLNSIDEIKTQIFFALFPFLKKKGVKLASSLVQVVASGITSLNNLGDFSKYVELVGSNKNDWIKLTDLVICFDDLERRSSKIEIEEIIGYINSLVEHDNVKVIIIANEKLISDEEYKKYKEKIIGSTIEFRQDLIRIYDDLIKKKFSGFQCYKSFLTQNKEYITDTFSHQSSNIRILIFALSYFQTIYSELEIALSSVSALLEKKDEIQHSLLKFVLAISIEYKLGEISYTNRGGIDAIGTLDLLRIEELISNDSFGKVHHDNLEVEEPSYPEKFRKKFYLNDKFYFFKTVYDFITGGAIINNFDLQAELKSKYHITEEEILPQYEILNQLEYPMVFSLMAEEYNSLTRKMLKYCDEGSYAIKDYIQIFIYALRFRNPLNFNPKALESRIIRGVRQAKVNSTYNNRLMFDFSSDSFPEYTVYIHTIRDEILKLNNELNFEAHLKDYKRLEKLCHDDFKLFYEEVMLSDNNYKGIPFLINFNYNKFLILFLKSNNDERWNIINFLRDRYANHYDQLLPEIDFIEKLYTDIHEKREHLPSKGITSFIFEETDKVLTSALEILKSL